MFWVTSIPDNWKEVKIKHLFFERSEKGFPNEPLLSATQSRGVIPTALYENRTVVATKGLETLKLVEIGDFVISLRSFQGGIEYAYYRGIISPAYTVMTPKDIINRGYFKYLAKSYLFIDLLKTCVTGIREGQNINYSVLKKSYIPVPSKNEQLQIERFLDYKISKINKFIKDKKREINLLKEQKQAEINQAVTKGLNLNVPMKDSGIDWLGEIPKHWDVRYLSQVSKEQSISNKNIKNQNLLSLSHGKIINKDINTTNGLLPTSFDTYQMVNNGNIILRLTDLQNDHKSLRTGLVTQTGIITSAYTCLLPNDNILPEYLYFLLHSFDICKVFYGMGGGLRQSIGFRDIRRLMILLPSTFEQKGIVEKCNIIIDKIEKLISGIEQEISLTKEYKASLISEVVTGKIDIRGSMINEIFELETLDEIDTEIEAEELTEQ
jgi:type I restriction enzyme S subunit